MTVYVFTWAPKADAARRVPARDVKVVARSQEDADRCCQIHIGLLLRQNP